MIQTISAYLLIFFGVFIEGEFTFTSAVVAAHHHHLNIVAVVLIGFCATLAGDWIYFFIGRKKGISWIHKNPKFAAKATRAEAMIAKNRNKILLSYRFFYGLRTIIPILLGALETPPAKFMLYSFIGTLIWTAIITALGWVIGESILQYLHHIEGAEFYVIGVLILIALLVIYGRRYLIKNKMTIFSKH